MRDTASSVMSWRRQRAKPLLTEPGSSVNKQIRHPCFCSKWQQSEMVSKNVQKKVCLMLVSFKIIWIIIWTIFGNKKNIKSTNNTKSTLVPKFNSFCYQVNNKKKSELMKISALLLSFPIYYLGKQSSGWSTRSRKKTGRTDLEALIQGPSFFKSLLEAEGGHKRKGT